MRHLLSHTSGRLGLGDAVRHRGHLRLGQGRPRISPRQAPWWEPGTASGYHAMNYGHLIGEVIRRITGKTLKEFVRDEIAEPLGADVQIGARRRGLPPHRRVGSPAAAGSIDWTDCRPTIRRSRRSRRSHPTPTARRSPRPPRGAARTSAVPTVMATPAALARALSPISLGGKANGVQLLSAGDHRPDLR